MAGVTDTLQHPGHRQHPEALLTAWGQEAGLWRERCVFMCVVKGGGGSVGDSNMHSQKSAYEYKKGEGFG